MLKSMTGFGQAELKTGHGPVRVELKTVNHKFFELSARLPYHLNEYEDAVRKRIGQEIRRGKVNLFLSCPDPAAFAKKLALNESLAKEVYREIKRLRQVLNFKTRPDGHNEKALEEDTLLREVLRYPDVLTKESTASPRGVFTKEIERTLDAALKHLSASRVNEGKALLKDFLGRVGEIEKALKAIQKRIPVVEKEYRKSLESRMKDFLKDGQIDKPRLTLEVSLYVKNSDISEEVVRMKSHIDALRKALKENGELGRKIDFIAQEMYREANTMGAKSSDVQIAENVIAVKSAIEKIREQAGNIE